MPTSEAVVTTDRASRYLQQLCSHASRMGHGGRGHGLRQRHQGRGHGGARGEIGVEIGVEITAEATSDTTGRITRGAAYCDLTAGPAALALRVTADDEQQLRALQEAVARTLERIGRRDGLAVRWG